MITQKKLRICFVASAGGHTSQLLKLADSFPEHNIFCVTTANLVRKKLEKYGAVYVIGDCNRKHPFKALLILTRCIWIVLKERPDVVVSTGAAPGCILCLTGKLLGAKVVWIDSIANVERLSLSGQIVRLFADLFLAQWSKPAERYSNVYYVGELI